MTMRPLNPPVPDKALTTLARDERRMLDAASRRAERDIAEMIAMFDRNAREHRRFLAEIGQSRKAG